MNHKETVAEAIRRLHDEACERGDDMYMDPATGYYVFTREYLLRRGFCCGSACRHCPYNHENVPSIKNRRGGIPSIIIIVFTCLALVAGSGAAHAQYHKITLDTVLKFTPGAGQNAGQGGVFFPKNIFGEPGSDRNDHAPTVDPRHLCSIGFDGDIIVGFKNYVVVDGPGADFVVFENAFKFLDRTFAEPAEVSVSADGINFIRFPFDTASLQGCAGVTPNQATDPYDPSVSGGDVFDLATIGVDTIRWIRIHDVTTLVRDNPKHKYWDPTLTGFDLDAVTSRYGVQRAFENRVVHDAQAHILTFACTAKSTMQVISVHGAVVETVDFAAGITTMNYDHLPHGAWICVLFASDGIHVVKVLRQ